jgi:16S rRNA processing protein RimM
MDSGFLMIGKVVKPHGLRGLLKIESYASSLEPLSPGQSLYANCGGEMREWLISETKVQKQSLLVKLLGVDHCDQAEALRGYALYIKEEDLQALPKGEYYWYQLIGSRVCNEQGRSLGILEQIFSTPAHDIWVIRDGEKECLIPAVEDFILSVNQTQREIRVKELFNNDR